MEKDYRQKYYIIITPFFPSNSKFQGPFIYDLAKAIERSGKYKSVLVFKPRKWNDKRLFYYYQGIKVYLFDMVGLPSLIFNGIFNDLNAWLFLKTFKKLNIPVTQIAVAHGHTSSFGALCLALKKQNEEIITVLHHHDPDPYTIRNGKFASNWLNLYIRAIINIKLFNKIDWHVPVSNYVKTNLLSFPSCAEHETYPSYLNQLKKLQRLHIRESKISNTYVLYNGVDLSKFHPVDKNKNAIFTIGCIGNFVDWKNQITLLEAVNLLVKSKRIKHLNALFIGSGPKLQQCIDFVKKNDLSQYVKFLKEVDHTCLPSFYHKLDIFVLPSYFEGFGCVFTEAAASGVPYIIGEHQGAAEYIADNDVDKWTVPPLDADKLADLIFMYYCKRSTQHYKYPFDINILVNDFLKRISQP